MPPAKVWLKGRTERAAAPAVVSAKAGSLAAIVKNSIVQYSMV